MVSNVKQQSCIKCGKKFKRIRKRITGLCKHCYTTSPDRFTEEIRTKLRVSKLDKKNPMWKGDNVGYAALHEWITSRKPKPRMCECCNLVPPRDLANISQKYKRNVMDWEWLCRKCHMNKDGRLKKMKKGLFKGHKHQNYGNKTMREAKTNEHKK